jgi:hypothetical protein
MGGVPRTPFPDREQGRSLIPTFVHVEYWRLQARLSALIRDVLERSFRGVAWLFLRIGGSETD